MGADGLGISAGALIYAAMHILAGPGIGEEGARRLPRGSVPTTAESIEQRQARADGEDRFSLPL